MSINNKFFKHCLSNKWQDTWKHIDKDGLFKGFELYIDIDNIEDITYSKEIVSCFKDNKWDLQIHGIDLEQYERKHGRNYKHLLNTYLEFANLTNKEIIITFHPITKAGIPQILTLVETYYSISELCNQIVKYNYPFKICIENLNKLNGVKRPNIFELSPLLEIEKLSLCWDIGHDVSDNICEYYLHDLLFKRIKNIHLHDIGVSDHYPFYYGKTDYERSLLYLKNKRYNDNIVLEVALDYLMGNSYDEKISKLCTFVKDKLNPLL